jgi:hypothetical protein
MAIFGFDHAFCAAQATLRAVDDVDAELHSAGDATLRIGIALNTGWAIAGQHWFSSEGNSQ